MSQFVFFNHIETFFEENVQAMSKRKVFEKKFVKMLESVRFRLLERKRAIVRGLSGRVETTSQTWCHGVAGIF